MYAIELKDLHKRFNDHLVLQGINLHIEQNSIFGLIGLNGAGKTSLLKCLLDLHQITSGDAALFDIPCQDKNAREQVYYLPEKFNPPEYMSGSEYLKFIIDGYHVSLDPAGFKNKIDALAEKMDLEHAALQKPIKSYSKGMTQKLGIIGGLLSDKAILILDEPMSGLDPKARVLFRDMVSELKQKGKTVFFCTHILSDIERLCDQIGILHKGRLQFVGSPQDCCEQYQQQSLEQAFLQGIQQ